MGCRMGEPVEEKADKTQRRGAGDHACMAVSVLQRETDSEKEVGIKMRERKIMSCLAFARV